MILFLVVLTMMMIALTAAAPRLAQQIKRDREIEMIHRGEQYARAIGRYYKKFGHYPGRIEDLENTNTLRFLRKRYKDPITGGAWRLVRFGEVQFSQAGGVGTPAALLGQAQTGAPQSGAQGSQSGFGSNFFGGSSAQQNQSTLPGVQGNTTAPGVQGNTTTPGAQGNTPAGGDNSPSAATTGTTEGSGSNTGSFGQSGSTFGQTGSTFGQSGTGASGQTSGSSSSLFSNPASTAQPGQGGGAIIGVASQSKATGIHEFNKKTAYKDWLFIYDPAQDRPALAGTTPPLLHGPYNPQAVFGQAAGGAPAGTSPAGATTPGTPGATGTPGTTGNPGPTMGMPSPSTGQLPGGIVPNTQ
jgi:type II secretory pathway pseudopilin PulG